MRSGTYNRVLLFVVTAIFWFALYTYVPYVSPYGEYLGADLRLIGLIIGSYGFTQMLIRFPLGIISDWLGKRKIFVISGLFFAAISGVIIFFFPHPMILLATRSGGGVAAASWVVFAILGASYYKPDEAVKSVGFLNSANSLGRILAFFVGGVAAQWLGVPYAFFIGGIAGSVGLCVRFFIIETKPQAITTINTECETVQANKTPTVKELLLVVADKQLLTAALLAIICMYISFSTAFGFTPLLAEELGAGGFQLGMLGIAAALPGLLVSPLAGTVLSKKLGMRCTIAMGFVIAAIGCALLIVTNSIVQLYVIQIVISTGTAMAYTLLMGLSIKDIPSQSRATAMGFFQAVYGLGMFVGPFVTGMVAHSAGLSIAFICTSGVGGMGALLATKFVQKNNIT